jgi:hypothetical protein
VTTFPLPPDAAAYLAAVRARLADLPADERDDLLADLETSLIEGGEEGSIAARLGPPDRFAAELRAAAGIQPAGPAPHARRAWLERVAAALDRLRANPRVAAAQGWLLELAPIWWLARAYVAGAVVALIAGIAWSIGHPELPRFSNASVTALVFAALAAASLWLGVRSRRDPGGPRRRGARAAINVALAIAVIPVVQHGFGIRAPVEVVVVNQFAPSTPGLAYNGVDVTNLYPYSRSGRLLQDVLIYDGAGNPLNLGAAIADPNRRVLVTAAGRRVFNSFPIRYFEPQTTFVAHPYAGPPVQLPQVLTPPLVARLKRAS